MTCRVCGLPNESAWGDPDGVCSTCREADKPKTCRECKESRQSADMGLPQETWAGYVFCEWQPVQTPTPMWAGKLTAVKVADLLLPLFQAQGG